MSICEDKKTLLSTAILTSSESTRKRITNITKNIEDIKSNMAIDNSKERSVLLDSAEKELEATVYATLLSGENRAVYKGLLVSKFKKGLNHVSYDNMVSILDTIDNGGFSISDNIFKENPGFYKTLGFDSAEEIGSLVMSLQKDIENKLLTDYVYFGGEGLDEVFKKYSSIKNKSYEKLGKTIANSDNIKEAISNVVEKQSKYFDVVLENETRILSKSERKAIRNIDKLANNNAINNYLAFVAITNPKTSIKEAINASEIISESSSRGLGSIDNIKKLSTPREMQEFVVSNIGYFRNNKEAINAIKKQYNIISGGDNLKPSLEKIMNSAELGFDANAISISDIVKKSIDSFEKSIIKKNIAALNAAAGKELNVNTIVKKLSYLDDNADEFIKQVIKSYGKNVSKEAALEIEKIANNIAESILKPEASDNLGSYVVERISGKPIDINKSAFFESKGNINDVISDDNAKIAKAMDESYAQNSIEISDAPLTSSDTSVIFEKWKSGDISYLIVKNQDEFRSSEIQELLSNVKDYVVKNPEKEVPYLWVSYPREQSLVSYFVKDGKLYAGSWNRGYMASIIDSLQDANLPITAVDASNNIVQATKDALEVMYGKDNAYAIEKLRINIDKENYADIAKDLKVIHSLRDDMTEGYYNLAEKYENLPNDIEWFRDRASDFAKSIGLDYTKIQKANILTDVEDIKKIYLSAVYGETTQSIARGQNNFLQAFGIDGGVSVSEQDRWYNILQEIRGMGFEIPFGDATPILKSLDGFGEIDNSFLQRFVVRNRSIAGDDFDVNKALDIFKNAKQTVESTYVNGGAFDISIADETKRMFRFHPQNAVREAKNRVSNLSVDVSEGTINTSSILSSINSSLDNYYNSVESIIKKNGRLTQEDAVALKQEMFSALRVYEDELKNRFGDIIPQNKIYRNAFEVKKINELSEIPYLYNNINELKKRYGNLISEIEKKIASGGKSTDDIVKKGYVVDTIDGKTREYTIDNAIEGKIKELSGRVRGIESFKGILGENVELSKKQTFLKILNDVESKIWASGNVVSKIYETLDPSLKGFITSYKVSEKNGRILPSILHDTNATRHLQGANVLDYNIDLDVKESIFKNIKRPVIDGNLTPQSLSDIINKEIDKVYVDMPNDIASVLDTKSIHDAYFAAFAGYTKLIKIPQDIIDAAVKLSKKTTNYTEQELHLLKGLSIDTADGVINLADFSIGSIDTSMPDVLYRTSNESIQPIGRTLSKEELSVFKDNVESMVDEFMNGFDARQSFNDSMNVGIFNQAKPIMQREGGRLSRWVTIHNVLKSSAEKAHFSLMDSILGKGRTILRYYFTGGYGSGAIPLERLNEFKKAFSSMVSLPNQEFNVIDPARLSQIDGSAFKVATYVKKYKANIENLTTDQVLNEELSNSVENAIMSIKDMQGLEEVATAIRNFTPFSLIKNSKVLKGIGGSMVDDLTKSVGGNRGLVDLNNKFFGSPENMNIFNELFNSKLGLYDYRTVVASMFGLEKTGLNAFDKFIKRVWRRSTTPFMRSLFSIPGSFMTAPISTAGYINEYQKLSKQLGVGFGDMEGITAWRMKNNILTQEGPDASTMMRGLTMAISESKSPLDYVKNLSSIFATENGDSISKKLSTIMKRSFDSDAVHTFITQTFDNGQNIVDGIFGSSMKNMSTIYAIKNNKYMKFTGFDDFSRFMDNPNISEQFKRKIQQDIVDKSYDMYQTIISYGGSAIYKSVNNGRPITSQAETFFTAINNPINFRGSLGTNTLKEIGNVLATSLKAVKDIAYNPSKAGDIINALANNVHIQKMSHSIWFDALMAARIGRLNNKGESADDRDISADDIKEALGLFSLQYQLAMTSGLYRVANAAFDGGENRKGAMINSYVNNYWRQLKGLNLVAGGMAALSNGGVDGFNSYMENTIKTASTAAARMFVLDRDSASSYTFVPQNKSGMGEVWGSDNEWLKAGFMAGNVMLEEKMRKSLVDGKIDSSQITDLTLDIINQTQGGRAFMGVLDTFKAVTGIGKPSDKMLKNKDDLVNILLNDVEYKDFIKNGFRYSIPRPSATASEAEWKEYYNKLGGKGGVFGKLSIYGGPGWVDSSKGYMEAGMIKEFKKNGTTGNEYMDALYREMDKDGVLDSRLDKMNSTPSNQYYDGAKILNQELADYIQSKPIEDRPAGSDLVMLTMLVGADYSSSRFALQKARRQQTGDKKYKLSNDEMLLVKSQIAEKYLQRYQDIKSDGVYSHGGFDLLINSIVRKNPDVLEGFVKEYSVEKTDSAGEKYEDVGYTLNGGYKKYLEKTMETQADILSGKSPWDAIVQNYGPQNFIPNYRKGDHGENLDDSLNLAAAVYMNKWIQSRDDLSPLQKAETRVSMFSKAGLSWKNEDKIKEVLGEQLYNNYKFSYYQAYNDGIQQLNDIYDSSSNGGGKKGGISIKVPNLGGIGEGLSKMKSSISKGDNIPSQTQQRRESIRPFEYDGLTTKQDRQAGKSPSYSATSQSYFKQDKPEIKTGKDINRKISPTKISLIKKSGAKKS